MIALLVNPAAGGGRAAQTASSLETALAQALGDVARAEEIMRFDTCGPGTETPLARDAVARGARVLVVVGGDGTVHHALRGLLEAGAPIPLAVCAAGTGNDFVKTIATPAHDPVAMAALVVHGGARLLDIGEIDGVPFLNAAGVGFDVEVLRRMADGASRPLTRRLGGTAAYVGTALSALFGYGGVRATWLGHTRPHLLTVFANGRYFGGAFRIAPTAAPDDGLLDVVSIGAVPPWARPAVFLRAVRGTHLGHRAVQHLRMRETTVHFDAPPWFQADGELYRARGTALTVRVRPGAVRVLVSAP